MGFEQHILDRLAVDPGLLTMTQLGVWGNALFGPDSRSAVLKEGREVDPQVRSDGGAIAPSLRWALAAQPSCRLGVEVDACVREDLLERKSSSAAALGVNLVSGGNSGVDRGVLRTS
jgi:hypothetical protein